MKKEWLWSGREKTSSTTSIVISFVTSKTEVGDIFSFDLGERTVKLQVQVKHGATGFSEHNRVYIYLTNKSDDLTFNLQLKTQNGVWRWMATKESPFLLPFGKKFPMFSFPAASCLAHCDPSRSLHVKTRMEFFYYITLTKKPSESPDHLEELPSASDSGGWKGWYVEQHPKWRWFDQSTWQPDCGRWRRSS